ISRDLKERGRSFESIENQYIATVKPMHEFFVEPSKKEADVIVPRGGENQIALDLILARLAKLLESPQSSSTNSGAQ
ncbi:MAG: uridine kinase, partial [Chlamydiae bacterium]|nr:uridine kinase [Chlamydiota bacterium]